MEGGLKRLGSFLHPSSSNSERASKKDPDSTKVAEKRLLAAENADVKLPAEAVFVFDLFASCNCKAPMILSTSQEEIMPFTARLQLQ